MAGRDKRSCPALGLEVACFNAMLGTVGVVNIKPGGFTATGLSSLTPNA